MLFTTDFTLETLVKTELPPLPGSVMRISAMLQDYNISQRAVANAIGQDPALSMRILRLANSPIYALQRTISNMTDAVAAVGNNSISESLMITGIGDSFGSRVLNSEAGREIWFHLLATAMTAGDMCRAAKLRGADEAFSGGLLHDIGKLIFLKADPARYFNVIELSKKEGDIRHIEREVFGFDHVELGSRAAEAWSLPEAVCDMIRCHHEPHLATEGIAVTRIVSLANSLANYKKQGLEIDDLLWSEAVLGFGFTTAQFEEIWENTLVRIREVMRSLF